MLAIEELARGIQRRRHGGTLVFVRSDDRVWKSLCNIRYEIESLNGGAWPGSHVVQLLHNDGAILSGRYSEGWNQRKTEALRELNRVRLFEACDAVAALSGADGAVVLRTELEQVAFGVELKASSSGRDEDAAEVRYEDSSFTIHRSRDIAEYGTRHRSAFRFCKADPNAVCVVVSQDGAVKVVFNHDDTVMYLDNADEGFFGL